ncbi:hypothetical protein ACFU6I_13000 [Streptomyces sp. NPDC057486]|uniref:hypothetical protein n=1 Tax=Streptomyces sp. NPDC057486 TaxID=3346145 RepID=UPI00369D602A
MTGSPGVAVPAASPLTADGGLLGRDRLRRQGVVGPGRRYCPAEPRDTYLRPGSAAAADPAEPTEGAHRLGAAARGAER